MHCIGTEEILNRIDDGVILTAPDKTIVFANRAFLRLFQATEEQVVGAKCHEICHQCSVCTQYQGFPSPAECPLDETFQLRQSKSLRYQHLLPNNENRIFQVAAYPLFSGEGAPARLLQLFKDITHQEKLQEAAERSHRELRQIFDSAPFSISYLDRERRVIRLNPVMESLVGLKSEEAAGRHCYDCWGQHAKDPRRTGKARVCDTCGVDRAVAEGRSQVCVKKNGAVVTEVITAPVRNQQGAVVGTMEVGRDITDQYLAEKALRASEKRYRVLFENSPSVLCIGDFSGIRKYLAELPPGVEYEAFFRSQPQELANCIGKSRIIEVNQAACRLFGAASPSELIAGLFRIIGSEAVPQTLGGICAIGRGMASFEHEMVTRHLVTGENIHGILRWNMHPGYEKSYTRVILSFTDISAWKKAEEAQAAHFAQVRRLSSQLVETEESERRRISRELHDSIGQQLTALGINLHILRRDSRAANNAAHDKRFADSLGLVEEMTQLVRDIMADLRPPVLDDYGLSAALRWHAERFAKRTGIRTEITGETLPRFAPSVEMTLFRVVQEALNNVAKHSRASRVEIRGTVEKGRLFLVVQDNGRGFPDAADTEAPNASTLGIISMGERIGAIGGTLAVSSAAGLGVMVSVEVGI